MGPTLAGFLRSLVPPGTLRIPDRILVIFQGRPGGAVDDQAGPPGLAFSDISRKSEVFVWEGCKFHRTGFSAPGKKSHFQ